MSIFIKIKDVYAELIKIISIRKVFLDTYMYVFVILLCNMYVCIYAYE